MTPHKLTLALVATLALPVTTTWLGCSSSELDAPRPDAGDLIGEPPEPTDIFESSVKPLVIGCRGAQCHSGPGTDPLKFLGPGDEALYYDAMVQHAIIHGNWNLQRASMIEKLRLVAEQGGTHYGFEPYTEQELDVLAAWFQLEREARGPNNDPITDSPLGVRELLAQWVGCMTLDDWNASNMGSWASKSAGPDTCSSCHDECQYWFCAFPDSDVMFLQNRTELYAPGFFAVQINPDGSEEITAASDKLTRLGEPVPGGAPHPSYDTTSGNEHFQALAQFYELTRMRVEAGLCDEPGFEPL